MYVSRAIESKLEYLSEHFPVVLVCGARQVGKTTLLEEMRKRRPKLYFMDTGLACYLSMWNNPRALELFAMAGAMFETYVVSEIIKGYVNQGIDVRSRMFYYRDNNGKEIDLMIFENGKLYPIEIKKSADPGRDALKNFTVLDGLHEETGAGAVICMTPVIAPLDEKNKLIPIGCI